MVNPILAVVLGALLAVAAVASWFRLRSADGVRVAHTRTALQHPRFRKRLAMLRVAVASALALALFLAGSAAYLAGRPVGTRSLAEELGKRDIMACLDVSGSVLAYDAEVLRAFSTLADSFEGERVGMSFFNSGSRLVFPLTSDYELVKSQIDAAATAMTSHDPLTFNRLMAGTEAGVEAYGSSLIGDGLMACLTSFDFADQERARTIVFATDNQLAGEPIFTLAEGIERARENGVVIHGIYISGPWSDDNAEMQELLEANGMYYYPFNDIAAGKQIVEAVQAQDVANVMTEGEAVVVDQPGYWPAVVAGLLVVFLALAWRFKL